MFVAVDEDDGERDAGGVCVEGGGGEEASE